MSSSDSKPNDSKPNYSIPNYSIPYLKWIDHIKIIYLIIVLSHSHKICN